MRQTSGFISTYSADTFGVCSALFELGGMVVMHDASGCNSTYTTHDEPRWYDMDSMVYISGLTEIEVIMGDDAKLIADITEAAKELSPKFIAIAGTPIPAMTGFDFDAASAVITAETGIPAFGFKTTGMKSYIYGAGEAFLRIADGMVNKDITRSEKPSMNILGLTPLDYSINGSAESVISHFAEKGYEIISTWAMGCTLDDVEKAGAARLVPERELDKASPMLEEMLSDGGRREAMAAAALAAARPDAADRVVLCSEDMLAHVE